MYAAPIARFRHIVAPLCSRRLARSAAAQKLVQELNAQCIERFAIASAPVCRQVCGQMCGHMNKHAQLAVRHRQCACVQMCTGMRLGMLLDLSLAYGRALFTNNPLQR